jgi:hypothetical protein
MKCDIRLNPVAVGLAALAAVLIVACDTAGAQTTKPFQIVGAGIAPAGFPFPGQSAPHWAVGKGSFLGAYYGLGAVQNDSITFLANGDATGTFESDGPFVFTGQNGDQLACYYGSPLYGPQGTYYLLHVGGPVGPGGTYQAFFLAEFVPFDPDCTGIFKGVSGGWSMLAITAPFVLGSTDPVAYEWQGKGFLTFPRK